MKRVILVIPAIVALLFAACTTRSPETGYYIGWGVVGSAEDPFTINMDNGSRLIVLTNLVPNFELENDKRVIVDYSIIEQVEAVTPTYNVRVNMLYNVLSKPLLEQSCINSEENDIDEDSVGYDPIRINRANFSGVFLNLAFQIKAGNSGVKHWINLVYDDIERDSEIKGDTAFLRLRHNAFGDPATQWTTEQNASFPLSTIIEPPQTERLIKLIWTDYTGKTYSSPGLFKLNSTADGKSGFFFATLVE